MKHYDNFLNAEAGGLKNQKDNNQHSEITNDEERDFINALLNSSGISLIVLDENNKIIRVNESLTRLYLNKYAVGDYIFNIMPEPYSSALEKSCERVRKTGENFFAHTISHIGGSELHMEWTLSRIDTADENIKYISAVGIDVTEKYLAKANSKENEELLQIIMSHAQDVIIVSDNDDNIIIVNEAAEKMFGYSSNELRGKPMVPSIIPEEYKEEFMDDVEDGIMVEIYAVNKAGDRLPVELSISKIKSGGKTNTLYVIRDTSLRKQRENEIFRTLEKAKSAEKAKSEFLANMSHEIRTPLNGIIGFLNLLKQTPLDKTQIEYLNIINSSSDSLLSIINDVLDFSKIESGKMTLETIEFNATEVFEQVTDLYAAKAGEKGISLIVITDPKMPEWLVGDQLRLKQILSNLLSNALKFTNTGGNVTVEITVEECNVNKCVLRISVKDTGIGISKEKQASIFDAFSQADTSVTRKYGGSGLGLTICTRIAKLMGDSGLQLNSEIGEGSEFYFSANFDIGINKAKEKPVFKDVHIASYDCSSNTCIFRSACGRYMDILKCNVHSFETFEELESLEKVDVIVMGYRDEDKELIAKLAEKYKDKPMLFLACDRTVGSLKHLESKTVRTLGQPLNISKFLDAFTFLIRKNTNITQAAIGEEQGDLVFSGHALVVEDNAVNRRLADIMLRQFGLTVELAVNGKEALNLFSKSKYDIIFMDVHMPVLDGVSATKEIIRIESIQGMPHTPIVALTANVIQGDKESYLDAGMDGFLAKPIEKSKLEDVLMEFLDSDKAKYMLNHLGEIFEIDDIESVRDIVEEFFKVAFSQVKDMRKALKSEDYLKFASIANSLKGAAMNLRFNNLVLAAKRIETNISEEKDTDYSNIIDDLETELMRIKSVIR